MAKAVQKEIYYVYVDAEHGTYECRNNNKVVKYSNIHFLQEIINSGKKSIVFINHMSSIIRLISGGEESGVKTSAKTGISESLVYTIGKVELRNFSALYNNVHTKDLCKTYKTACVTWCMERFIREWGKPERVKWSLAHVAQERFYEDIAQFLIDDRREKKRYFNSLYEYNLAYAGCKAGFLMGERVFGKKIDGYDISSAYSSVFVNDNKFPIGRLHYTKSAKVFAEEYKKGTWVKVIFFCRIDGIDHLFYDDRLEWTALEYYDIELLKELGYSLKELLSKYDHIFLYSDETGMLHGTFRGKIMSLYNKKQELEKGTIERDIVKVQLEMLYGKGLQWHEDWTTDKDVIDYYRPKGKYYTHYMLPQFSNHAVACIRYRLVSAFMHFGEETAYADTDGIKVKHSEYTEQYFREINAEIRAKNAESGYISDIGTWTHEGTFDEFVCIGRKVYAYRVGDEITFTAAGMDREGKKLVLDTLLKTCGTKERLMEYFYKNGTPFVVRSVYIDGESIRYRSDIYKCKEMLEDGT